MLAVPPSFMISPTVPLLFVASHIVANALPELLIPNLDLQSELPLSLVDAATRSMLVCDGVTSIIKSNPNALIRSSPMALLITSTVTQCHISGHRRIIVLTSPLFIGLVYLVVDL